MWASVPRSTAAPTIGSETPSTTAAKIGGGRHRPERKGRGGIGRPRAVAVRPAGSGGSGTGPGSKENSARGSRPSGGPGAPEGLTAGEECAGRRCGP